MEDLIERLERLFAAGDLDQAAAVIRTYQTADPVRHALGLAALAAHDKAAAAEETYRRMLELDPENVQALNGLGACRYKQKDLDDAVTCFARAYDRDPTDPAPIRSMMNMYGEAGRVLGAISLANLTR